VFCQACRAVARCQTHGAGPGWAKTVARCPSEAFEPWGGRQSGACALKASAGSAIGSHAAGAAGTPGTRPGFGWRGDATIGVFARRASSVRLTPSRT
jgi:hypothetical protein